MKQNGQNDYNDMEVQVKENDNKISLVNDNINNIISSIIEKLLNRIKEIKQKETNVLNTIKNKIDLNIKQNRIDKVKDLLNVMERKNKEHKELSQQEIKEIIDTFYSCMKISQQQFYNDNNDRMNDEMDIKHIIVSCLLNETQQPNLYKKKKRKTTSLNNYVNNSLSRKGYIKPTIRIQKNNKYLYTHLSSNQLIENNDTLTSYLNKKCESNITEQSSQHAIINQNQTFIQQSKIKLKKPINKITQRNVSKNHLKTFSIENNKIKRSISTLSKQSRAETTKESLSKKKSLKSEKYAELFVNVNTLSEKSKLTNKTPQFDNSSIYSERNLNMNTNNSQSKQYIILTQPSQNVKRSKSNDSDNVFNNSFTKGKRSINSVPKKHSIKKHKSIVAKITSPSLLNDYGNKKEKIKTKAKLSYLIHILNKLYKRKLKEMVIQCFYDFYLFYKQQINITFKRKQRPTHKLTLNLLFRKRILNLISFSLQQIIPIYNKTIKKSNMSKIKSKVHNSNKSQLQSSHIQNKDNKRSVNKNSLKNEELMVYMPNPQDYENNYEMLNQKPVLVNDDDIDNNFDQLTIEPNDYIYTSDDEIITKKNIVELLENQQEQLHTTNNLQQPNKEKQCLFNNELLIKDCEKDVNVSDGLHYNEFQSIPIIVSNKCNNDNDQNEDEETDCSKYYEALNRLKQLNEETKKIEENMKVFLESV